jgi:hypothetical protein
MAMEVKLIVTPTCVHRSGVAKVSGNPYTMAECFVVLDGVDFPQKFEYYCSKEQEVLPPGEYVCPLKGNIKDGRVEFSFDPRQSRRVPNKPTPQA